MVRRVDAEDKTVLVSDLTQPCVACLSLALQPHFLPSSMIPQSRQSTSHLVLDHLQNCGNPAKCRLACSDCHLTFVLEDIPVCPRRVFHDAPSKGDRLEAAYLSQGCACGHADCLRLVSHIFNQLNNGLITKGGFSPGVKCLSGRASSHLTLEPVAWIKSGPEVPEAASSRGGP